MGRLSGTTSGGRLSSGRSGGRLSSGQKLDLQTLEGLTEYAKRAGLGNEAEAIVNPKNKLSVLQRLSTGLSALNPAEAILTGNEQGFLKGVKTYVTGFGRNIASAVTGTDYNPNRRFFKDVAEKVGVENGIAKFGIGFLGDVLLDPSTYFGGAIAKGITGATKGVGNVALKTVGRLAPETETGLRLAGKGLSEAFGRAFKFGYKTTRGATDDVANFLSRSQKAKLGLAESNLNRLGTGILSKEQSQELALKLIAGKRAEFAAREVGGVIPVIESSDPLVQKIIKEQTKRTQKFASQLGLENPYETYFPFIRKDKLENFIKSSGSSNLRVGSEGYTKQFRNLLTDGAIETNPAKAFFTSEVQQVSDRMTRDFLGSFVKKYGKPLDVFKNSDDAAKAGYELIKDKGIFGKAIGYLSKYDSALIRDSISPEFQTINMLAKATGFDAVTSLFKRSVTGLFAPFHIRNFMSGHVQNFEVLGIDALNPKNISIGQKIAYIMGRGSKLPDSSISIGGKSKKLSDIIKPFIERFSGDTFYNADFENALNVGSSLKSAAKVFSKERLKETIKTIGLGQEAIPFKVGRAIGQYIEHAQKATAYITALNQGRGVQEALELATRAGFDYRQLTRFESQIMKRIIPFYSFTRKNIELQLRTLGENPQRINQILRFFGNIGTSLTDEEKKNLPAFIRESVGIKLEDTPEGLKQYISSFNTPIEAFTQLFGSNPILRTISQMNPILKAPIEIGIGQDSYRQRDLKEVYQANEYKNAPQVIKDLLNITEVEKPILKKGGDGKLVKVGTKKQYVADPVRLLIARSLFTSRGVSYLDQVFDNNIEGFVKFIKLTTGIKLQEVDIQVQESIQNTNKKREIEDLLKKRSGLNTFTTVYEKKN